MNDMLLLCQNMPTNYDVLYVCVLDVKVTGLARTVLCLSVKLVHLLV